MKDRIFGKVSKTLTGLALLVGTTFLPMKEARADTNAVVNMTNNLELTWNWATQYQFSASSAGNGSVNSTNDWYDSGTPVTATAIPNQFYHFIGWSGETNSSQNPITLAINKPYSLVANFAKNTTVNGIDHEWLYSHNIATNDASESLHSDSDPYNNLEEWIADTDPTNGNSYPPAMTLASGNSMDVTIDPTSSNRAYDFESKTNLVDGLPWKFETNMLGNGSAITYEDSENVNMKFYRYKVKLP